MTILGERRSVGADLPVSNGAPHDLTAPTEIPAITGAWRPEMGPGDRLFAEIGPLALESGAVLEEVTIAYETWGELAEDGSNAVLVLHALTGDSHVLGTASSSHPVRAGGSRWWGRGDP